MNATTIRRSVKCVAVVFLLALGSALSVTPVAAQSLKTVPSNQDLFDLLHNPMAPPAPRVVFPGLPPLPPLDVHPLTINTLTAQPLLVDPNDPFAISFVIPAEGRSPFVGGVPDRPLEVPLNETDFIVNREAAVQLGKALFWDMQVGSDGVQACGTCHFHAGADNRVRNQLNPGTNAGDSTLQVKGKNQAVDAGDFPFHKLVNPNTQGEPLLNPGNVVRDSNDVLSSMGVMFREFVDIPAPGPGAFIPGTDPPVLKPDVGTALPDPQGAVFQGVRRVEARNTPTFFAAANNFDNFWDGRARHDFNGGSPFGASDPFSHIFVNDPNGFRATRQLIRLASMASLATGPALSNFEMSFNKRFWAKLGKKLLQAGVVPLANQLVDPNDSVLGPLSNQRTALGMPGLNVSYAELIEQAFGSPFWSNTADHLESVADATDPFDGVRLTIVAGTPADPALTNQFTQKEANFSLFFGLAVQVFTQILRPDDSPFDQFHDANPDEFLGLVEDISSEDGVQVVGLSTRQLLGYDLFQGSNLSRLNPLSRSGSCNICHFSQELTEHSIRAIHDVMPGDPITGADKVLSGFMLERTLRRNAEIAMEMDGLNQALDGNGLPDGSALVDKGVYNIGVRPIAEDVGRGGNDPFGFPLSLSALALRKGGYPVGIMSSLAPPVPPLPATLIPFVNDFPIGLEFPNVNQTLFLPDTVSPTVDIVVLPSGTFPNPNRVARMGNFKVPQLKNVELTGPYMHNGGMLTLRQVIDFYSRAGDFPRTNAAHRDPLIVDLHASFDSQFTEADKVALTDFLLALTDERVKFERAPFDHPEIIIPVDGTAPDNTGGPATLLADSRFMRIPAVGAAGRATPLPNFLGISSAAGSRGPDHFDVATAPPIPNVLLSFSTATTLPGVGSITTQDIARYDSATALYSMYFDGSDVGLALVRIDAFCLLPDGDILMSFATTTTVPGLTGGPTGTRVASADIVRFHPTSLGAVTAGSFSFYFDGSDVGLTTSAENIDAIALDATGKLVLSIAGAGAATGQLGISGADLFRFTATSLGTNTAGSFAMLFDGSDVGLTTASENVDAAFIAPDGRLYVSTQDVFAVGGFTGGKSGVLRFTPTNLGQNTTGAFDMLLRSGNVGIPSTANLTGFWILP